MCLNFLQQSNEASGAGAACMRGKESRDEIRKERRAQSHRVFRTLWEHQLFLSMRQKSLEDFHLIYAVNESP